ncbi:uncharacterized protein [Anomalospiza imberbis]|uniref:uncharacterized protein isoform X1 n=1 Tax=Anomalospiza imberbis TaxID=187417 RepID=UPI00358E950E
MAAPVRDREALQRLNFLFQGPQCQTPPLPPLLLPPAAGGGERGQAARAWPAPASSCAASPAAAGGATCAHLSHAHRSHAHRAGHAHWPRPHAVIGLRLSRTGQSAVQK